MPTRIASAAVFSLTLAHASIAGAGCIRALPIINPGFEELSRALSLGELTNGAGGEGVPVGTRASFFAPPQFADTVIVPGWRTLLPPPNNPTATIRAGAMMPPVNGQTRFLSGYSGANVASLQNAFMQQTLAVMLEPNTRYELSFVAGFGVGTTPEAVYVWLLAAPDLESPYFANSPGVQVLAQTQGLFFLPQDEGLMLPYSLEYTSPTTLPASLRSKYIAMCFIGSDGIPITNYDDFRLTAESLAPPPCPGDINGDSEVDVDDLNAILTHWHTTVDECAAVDLANGDAFVDVDDLNVVLGNWRMGCLPSPP